MGHHHGGHDHEHYYDDSKLHDNQHVFLKHYINMIDTCQAGLTYISEKYTSENLDLNMVQDLTTALKSIKDANFLAWNLMKKIDHDAYEEIKSFSVIDRLLNDVEQYHSENNLSKLYINLKEDLLPEYTNWSLNVKGSIKNYIPNK